MGRHDMCEAPVGISKVQGPPTWKYPPCILAVGHSGPHIDKDGNKEHMTILRREK